MKDLSEYYFMGGDDTLKKNKVEIYNFSNCQKPHHHAFIEIVYFKEGTGTHTINGTTYNICNGCIFIMNTNVLHEYIPYEADGKKISVKNLIFFSDFLGNFSSDNFLNEIYEYLFGKKLTQKLDYIYIDKDVNRDFSTLFNVVENELQYGEDHYLDAVKHCLLAILIKIFRLHEHLSDSKSISLVNKKMIDDSVSYITKHYNEEIVISELAKQVAFSYYYFITLFKNYTGMAPKKFIQKTRIEKAKEMLINTDDSVQSILENVGYTVPKHFFKLFKEIVGLSPLEYRKKYGNKKESDKT